MIVIADEMVSCLECCWIRVVLLILISIFVMSKPRVVAIFFFNFPARDLVHFNYWFVQFSLRSLLSSLLCVFTVIAPKNKWKQFSLIPFTSLMFDLQPTKYTDQKIHSVYINKLCIPKHNNLFHFNITFKQKISFIEFLMILRLFDY